MSKYAIEDSTLSGIADAIREKKLHNNLLTPEDMPEEIRTIPGGIDTDIDSYVSRNDEWERPVDWPDLDSIDITDGFDGVYMTYDLRKTTGYGWIGLYVQTELTPNTYTVERGHLENGVFVAERTTEMTQRYFRETLDEADGNIQLWRVSSEKHITRIGFVTNSTVQAENVQNNMQPMVERRGVLPYVTDLSGSPSVSSTSTSMGTIWLENDNMIPGGVVTTMSGMYNQCHRLEKVNLHWDTSNWAVRSLTSIFSNCYRLRSVDFSTWDTSHWEINSSLNDAFANCSTLKKIDLTPWDTSNWVVSAMSSMFSNDMSLDEIDFTGWDTTNWLITSLSSLFYNCKNIKKIKGIESFNTSNWRVTTIAGMFYSNYALTEVDLSRWDTSNWVVKNCVSFAVYCYSLKKLGISSWDTSGWAVTNMLSFFNSCSSLTDAEISGWDTSNWPLETIESIFASCFNIKELDLSGWVTSAWVLSGNGFRYAFNNMYSVSIIDLTGWDTSGWSVTDIRAAFGADLSLKSIPGIEGFNTSNWRVTYMNNMFNKCFSLEHLDLSGWDTSEWAVTNLENMFSECMRLHSSCGLEEWDTNNWPVTGWSSLFGTDLSISEVDLSGWNMSKSNLTSVYNMFGAGYNIDEVKFPEDLDLEKATSQTYATFSGTPTLKECNFYKVKNSNISISGWNSLSRASLLAFISKLQPTTTKRTFNIGQTNRCKLTAEEIAVATQKGWTVT